MFAAKFCPTPRYVVYRTPRSRLLWRNLAGWVEAARLLDGRPASRMKNALRVFHVRTLPVALIWEEGSVEILQDALDLLTGFSGFRQPPRGQRATAPHTPLIAAIKNRIKGLECDQNRVSIPLGHNSLSMSGGTS